MYKYGMYKSFVMHQNDNKKVLRTHFEFNENFLNFGIFGAFGARATTFSKKFQKIVPKGSFKYKLIPYAYNLQI